MIWVSVPASSANLGPGFDTLGLALAWRSRVGLEMLPAGLEVEVRGEGAATLPRGEDNLAVRAVRRVAEAAGRRLPGFRLILENRVPLERGLGSSAAVVVAAAVAGNALLGEPLGVRQLLQLAADLDGHPDNVAPALLGGLTLAWRSRDGLRAKRLDPPPLWAALAVPTQPLATGRSRECLPEQVQREDAVFNLQRVALWLYAASRGEWDCLRDAMEDRLHQPYRAALLPGLHEAIEAAMAHGAAFAALSGAGSTVIALTAREPQRVCEAMVEALARRGVRAAGRVVRPDASGARLERSDAVSAYP